MLIGVVILVVFVLIFTYAVQIFSFLGAVLIGALLGMFVSLALGHLGKRCGYAGVLELVLIGLIFRFWVGLPFAFDHWPGVNQSLGLGPYLSDDFRGFLWVVLGVAALISCIAFSVMWSDSDEDKAGREDSDQIQNGVAHGWSQIVEFFFWVPSWISRRFFGGREIADYFTMALVIAGIVGNSLYFFGESPLKFQMSMSAAIFLWAISVFRRPLKNAINLEALRIERVVAKRLEKEAAMQQRQREQDEKRRIEFENQAREDAIRAANSAKARQLALDKQRLLKEAIDEARPGQGKRTDLKPINEKDLRDDDLF